RPPSHPPDLGRDVRGWVDVCALDEIADKRGRAVIVRGTDVALMRDGERVHALGGTCPHRGGQIADGAVVDGAAICPLHLWDFELNTGISAYNPADRLAHYRARVRDGRVEIDADSVPEGPGHPDVYLGPWLRRGATDRGMHLIHGLAAGWKPPIEAMGSERFNPDHDGGRHYPSLDDLVFLPAQLARR
ncbi:MAG TPA: Rieske (2Fe-2S) protein, partial [Miltoncostaeaceae bacterium]|nr:Rieske (2Fe-2S) protein [Miltoncostaeaceae bacterium]